MSADGVAMNPELSPNDAIGPQGSSPDLGRSGALPNPGEVDVLRNSLSAVMVEYHEQAKNFTAAHARQSQEIAALTAQNLQLSREVAALAAQNLQLSRDVAALGVERDALGSQCSALEKRLFDVESSTSWVATRRLREVFTRHPRLRRLVGKIRRTLARWQRRI